MPPVNPLALAPSAGGTFIAQSVASDAKRHTEIVKEAISHPGFGFVNVFSPCVTFDDVDTNDYFRDAIVDGSESGAFASRSESPPDSDDADDLYPTDFDAAKDLIMDPDKEYQDVLYCDPDSTTYEEAHGLTEDMAEIPDGAARVLSNRSLAEAPPTTGAYSANRRHGYLLVARRCPQFEVDKVVRSAVTIAVDDVEASSSWYGHLLDCSSPLDPDHEHRELFDALYDDSEKPVLFLTRWDHHPLAPLRDAESGRPGHGVVLCFEVGDVESSWHRAGELGAAVVAEPHESRGFAVTEFTVEDPDGYYVSVSDPIEA